MLDPYIKELQRQMTEVENQLVAQGIELRRIDWIYEVNGNTIRARARLKTDDEMIGRCSDPSCCG